jgi:hypothetical protein
MALAHIIGILRKLSSAAANTKGMVNKSMLCLLLGNLLAALAIWTHQNRYGAKIAAYTCGC